MSIRGEMANATFHFIFFITVQVHTVAEQVFIILTTVIIIIIFLIHDINDIK